MTIAIFALFICQFHVHTSFASLWLKLRCGFHSNDAKEMGMVEWKVLINLIFTKPFMVKVISRVLQTLF